jgi:hypothetical protein
VHHRFANTTDLLATTGEVQRLVAASQCDNHRRPLRDVDDRARPAALHGGARRGAARRAEHGPRYPAGRRARTSTRPARGIEYQADERIFSRVL